MTSEQKFLLTLQHEAQKQAQLPSSHNRLTSFFWAHAVWFWLVLAFLSAVIFEFWRGRCG